MKLRNMFLILQKEYYERVRKRTFILTTLLTPVLMLLLMGAPAAIAHFTKDSVSKKINVAVIDKTHKIAQQLKSSELVLFDPIAAGDEQKARAEKKYDAYLYLNEDIVENHENVKIEGFEELTRKTVSEVRGNLNRAIKNIKIANYDIENLPDIVKDLNVSVGLRTMQISDTGEIKESSSTVSYFTGFIGGGLIYIFIFIYGGMVLNSVIDEKSSKVVEVMVSTVSPMHMMMGKIMGIGLVAITQFVIWGITMFIGGTIGLSFFADSMMTPEAMDMATGGMASAMPVSSMPSEIGVVLNLITDFEAVSRLLLLFSIFFIGGYLFYASMFAAVASAVDNLQDVQQLQTPIIIPIIGSMMFIPAVVDDPASMLSFWLSIIPFTSPIIMMARISSSIPLWELALSITSLYASFVGVVWIAGRIYRVGIFMHGKKPSFQELYKWVRYK